MHVHAECSAGEAKVWIEPRIEIAESVGLSRNTLHRVLRIVRKHEDEIRQAWRAHFGA